MAPEPVIRVVINGVNYVPEVVTGNPVPDVPATDPVKQRIVETYRNVKIDELKKVVSHEMKNVKDLGKRRVLTLDDGKQVIFNSAAIFYTVSKNDGLIDIDSVQNSANEIEKGTIFNKMRFMSSQLLQKEMYLSLPLYRVVAPAKNTESHPDVLRRQKSRLDRVNFAIVSKKPAASDCHPRYGATHPDDV